MRWVGRKYVGYIDKEYGVNEIWSYLKFVIE